RRKFQPKIITAFRFRKTRRYQVTSSKSSKANHSYQASKQSKSSTSRKASNLALLAVGHTACTCCALMPMEGASPAEVTARIDATKVSCEAKNIVVGFFVRWRVEELEMV